MKRIESAVQAYQDKLRLYIEEELRLNGGSYKKWYDDLAPFRKYIRNRYVWMRVGKEMYAYRPYKNKYGDCIDHHIVSYLAPLDYYRRGWNGIRMRPFEQIRKVSDYLTGGGKRLIVTALPNKGAIYPQLICDKPELYNQKTTTAPQYRKHILDLLNAGVEVVDIYPVFRSWADEHGDKDLLFSKDHHISPLGAKLIADTIANYLKETTEGLNGTLDVKQQRLFYYDNSASADNLSEIWINYTNNENVVKEQFNKNSSIAIFGDCNLQSYSNLGAGILGNLIQSLKVPVYDAGRMLIFDNKRESDNNMSKTRLDELKKSDIVIYEAFASAGFVRTSHTLAKFGAIKGIMKMIIKERSFNNFKWASFDL